MTTRINRNTPLVNPATGTPTLYGWSILQSLWRATGGEQSLDGTEAKASTFHIPRDPDPDLVEPSPLPPREATPDLEPVPVFLTPAQLTSEGATVVHKTADETIDNTSALQDDGHLFFDMIAEKAYGFELIALLDAASATPDWKFGWSVPTGATMKWGVVSGDSSVEIPWERTATGTTPATLLTQSDQQTSGSTIGPHGLIFKGIVACGTTSGPLQFRWAQNLSSSDANTVKKHSHLIIRELGDT